MDRTAEARWTGDLKTGQGHLRVGSGAIETSYSFISRFVATEGKRETNPEELLGAAHAACFSMALSNSLKQAGHQPASVTTTAVVHLTMGAGSSSITGIDLITKGVVPGLSAAEFQKAAEETKVGCIISQALSAVPMTVQAELVAG